MEVELELDLEFIAGCICRLADGGYCVTQFQHYFYYVYFEHIEQYSTPLPPIMKASQIYILDCTSQNAIGKIDETDESKLIRAQTYHKSKLPSSSLLRVAINGQTSVQSMSPQKPDDDYESVAQ